MSDEILGACSHCICRCIDMQIQTCALYMDVCMYVCMVCVCVYVCVYVCVCVCACACVCACICVAIELYVHICALHDGTLYICIIIVRTVHAFLCMLMMY